MSLSTYADLKTALTNWTKRADLSSYWDDIIRVGELWIFRNARVRSMETALSQTISTTTSVPSDFVQIKHAYLSGNPIVKLEVQSPEYIYDKYPNRTGGTPRFVGVEGSNFIFGPNVGSGTLSGIYYKRLAAVSISANDLFVNNPDLYLFASLAETEIFIKNDPRMALWTAKRDQILMDVNTEDKQSRGGSAMRMIAA